MKNRPTNILTASDDASSFSNEDALRLILNNLPENFLFIDRQLCIAFCNEKTKENIREFVGTEVTEGMSIMEIVPPERRAALAALYQEVFEGKEQKSETKLLYKGQTLYSENIFRPARSTDGTIVGAIVSSRNITEQKRSENVLKEIEERWRFALESGGQAVWDWNIQTGDAFYSRKDIYGYEDHEMRNRIEEWQAMIHPQDRERIERAIETHIVSSDPFQESTYRIITKDGRQKWIVSRGMLVSRDQDGRPLRMIGTHTDITDRVQAEERTRISEKQYRILFQSTPLPCWIYEPGTMRILEVNDAALEHYGYTEKEFLQITVFDLHPEHQLEQLRENIRRGKGKKSEAINNWPHKKKNGEEIFVDLRINSIEYKGSEAKLVVAHDVTAKVRVETELRISNERFFHAARASSEALWEWDVLADECFVSQAYTDIFGWTVDEHRRFDGWHHYIHEGDREETIEEFYSAIDDPNVSRWSKEYRYRKADGSYAVVKDKASILRNDDGKVTKVIGSMQDITERKYNEQLLALESAIFELSINPNTDLRFTVDKLLRGLEDIYDNIHASVVLLREDDTIDTLAAPSLPAELSESLRGIRVGPDEGSCGAAMVGRQTIIVEDIAQDPLWARYSGLALRHGLRSCTSLPIINSSGKVMGSFSAYFRQVRTPTPGELKMLRRIRNILRILVEQFWALNEIKVANERFDMMMKATHDLIWDWDLERNYIYRDEMGLKKVYGMDNNDQIKGIYQWLGRIHPEDQNRAEDVINDILQTRDQDTFDLEYRFLRDDGTYSYVYDRAMIIRDAEGRPVRMIGAAQDVTERKRLEQELLQNELERQRAINQATVDTQEQERSEIGKELHDNVNQVLTTTKLYLDLALTNAELKDELIQKSTKNIVSVINEIRQLSRSLMDPSIGDLGLIDSIHDLIDNINLTRKLHVQLKAEKQVESAFDKNQKLTVFRITQEALNNAIRHARATTVQLTIRVEETLAEIVIKDDGVGFHPLLVKKGAGLKNIQNRIYLINGHHTIQSAPGQGCRITIRFPIAHQPNQS